MYYDKCDDRGIGVYCVSTHDKHSYVWMCRTRNDEEIENIYAEVESGRGPFRYDFFKFETKIKSPVGRAIYDMLPSFLQPLVYPVLTFLFDQKLLTVDGKNFIEVRR